MCPRRTCVFLDWAEAYIGIHFSALNTFGTLQACRDRDAALESRLVASYSAPWKRLCRRAFRIEARHFSPFAAFAYAAGTECGEIRRDSRSAVAGYLRSLVRRMNREASQSAIGGRHA